MVNPWNKNDSRLSPGLGVGTTSSNRKLSGAGGEEESEHSSKNTMREEALSIIIKN